MGIKSIHQYSPGIKLIYRIVVTDRHHYPREDELLHLDHSSCPSRSHEYVPQHLLLHRAQITKLLSHTGAAACPAGCGTADACVLTETCTTATFSSPSTTITTCVPTATCVGVYCKREPMY